MGFRMSKFPPLLLRKWATTGSLSQNLFFQLQAKGEWLTIPESLKRKTNKGAFTSPNKKTRVLYELKQINKCAFTSLKRIYNCGVHLRLLTQTSSGGTCLPSLSLPILMRFLPRGDLISISISTFSTVLACLIPIGYVCEIYVMCLPAQFLEDMCTNSDFYRICACIFYS